MISLRAKNLHILKINDVITQEFSMIYMRMSNLLFESKVSLIFFGLVRIRKGKK